MGAFLERIGLFARSPDARPLAEIAADIDAELEFHVAESARALEQEGLAPDVARAEALKRFGDYGRIRRECARTQMGERIMLQRIQLVLTAALVAAVGVLAWSNQRAQVQGRAAMDAERQRTEALLARVEARLSEPRVVGPVTFPQFVSPVTLPQLPAGAKTMQVGSGGYLNNDGQEMDLDSAAETWEREFFEQNMSWRHGLKVAQLLVQIPGTQGVELMAKVWPTLSVPHREQAMKPFVFDGGHPNALEVLALGIGLDQEPSVRERAALYLETYSWQNLLYGDGTAERWLTEWRDRPVDEVLRANATRWARDFGGLIASYDMIPSEGLTDALLSVVGHVRPETFAKAKVDLGAILREHGVCNMTDKSLGLLSPGQKASAELVRSWCTPK